MTRTENLKRKIKALLSKTIENGATEAEAISAMNKAQELLQEIREDKEFINELKNMNNKHTSVTINEYRTLYRTLSFCLGELFDCIGWYNTNSKTYTVVGEHTDVDIYMYFYEYLTRLIPALESKYKDSPEYNSFHYIDGLPKRTIMSSYSKGLVSGISANIRQIYKDRISNFDTQMMVINKQREIENEISSMFPNMTLKTRTLTTKSNSNVFGAGKSVGKSVNINQPLANKNKQIG